MLFFFCACNELFFFAAYLLSFPAFFAQQWPWVVAAITGPVCLGKNIINAVQLVKAAVVLAERDVEIRKKAALAAHNKQ